MRHDDDNDKYLDPAYNPFIPNGEKPSGGGHGPFDDRAPFEPIEKDLEKAGGKLSARLDAVFPEGGIIELGGIKLVRLLGAWAREEASRIEALPSEDLERVEAAIREKERE